MSKSLSNTQRTLRELRKIGRICDVAERWQLNPAHPAGGVRKDMFGFIDLISLDPERGIVAIQSCGSAFSAHLRKITEECHEMVQEWLNCGGKVELWGWRKVRKVRGGKQMVWRPRIQEITSEDL